MSARPSYTEQLQSPKWQRLRLACLEFAGWKCQQCENPDESLHVHHKRYVKGRMAWEYERSELEVLCSTCHKNLHYYSELLDRLLAEQKTPQACDIQAAFALLAGFFALTGICSQELIDEANKGGLNRLFYMGAAAAHLGYEKLVTACE